MVNHGFDEQTAAALTRFFAVMTNAFNIPKTGLDFTTGVPASVVDMSAVLADLVTNMPESPFASRVPMVFPDGEDLGLEFVDTLRKVIVALGAQDSSLVFILPFVEQPYLENQRPALIARVRQIGYDAVLMGREDLALILASSTPLRQLRTFVLSQINLIKISPYRKAGPIPDHVFFGREAELSDISQGVRTTSFVVMGGRRIGKSALLNRLHRVTLPRARFRTVFHNCEDHESLDDFMSNRITSNDWRPVPPENAPSTMAELLASPPDDMPLVVLLDEADRLVPLDRAFDWKTFRTMRSIAHHPESQCQFVLTGARTLREAIRYDAHGPLYNFATDLLLGCLDFPAVEQLVTQPMRQLEVGLKDEATIVKTVYDFTSGHPNVVQRLCIRLIERINRRFTRLVTPDDVNSVIEDPGFQRDDFLEIFWQDATPLEKVISLLIAENPRVYTLGAIRQELADRCRVHAKAREVDTALQRLVDLRSILKQTPEGYALAVQAFPRVVAGTMTFTQMLQILTEEYQERKE